MEVASPLTFTHVQAGSKRRFACSPILDATMGVDANNTADDYAMDDCSHYGHKKRRRFGPSDGFESNQSAMPSSTVTTFASPQSGGSHAAHSHAHSHAFSLGKRQRNEDCSQDATTSTSSSTTNAIFLQRVIEKQNAEIQSLRQEKASMESTIHSMTESQAKMQHENKILKKAVTVQQQRQNQASTELEAARQYKEQAENKMRMLEQVISSLRYHLQAQQPHVGNDFMGPRPPDVF